MKTHPLAPVLANDVPSQPLYLRKDKRVCFRGNGIVRLLLDTGKLNLNDLSMMKFSPEDWEQFHQLIGYTVDGYAELHPKSRVLKEADEIAEDIRAGKFKPVRKPKNG